MPLFCGACHVGCWCFPKVGKEKDAFFVSARTRLSPRDGFFDSAGFFMGNLPEFHLIFCVVVCEIDVVNEIENYG